MMCTPDQIWQKPITNSGISFAPSHLHADQGAEECGYAKQDL